MNESSAGLTNKDWLSRTLQRLNLGPVRVAILLAGFNLVRDIILAIAFGAWLPSKRSLGLAAEPATWFYDLLLQPAILGYFCWIQHAGYHLVADLLNEGVLEPKGHSQVTLNKCRRYLHSRWLPCIAATLSLIFSTWFILAFTSPAVQAPSSGWVGAHPAITWSVIPVVFVVIYALVMFILDLAIWVIALNELFSNQEIRIEPLHPDKAGGLGSIGRFSANLGYGIGIVGLTYSVTIIQSPSNFFADYFLILGLFVYLTLAPIVFFLPIMRVHSAMIAYRNLLVTEISMEYDSVFERLRVSRSSDSEAIDLLLKKLDQLGKAHNLIMQFPVWPFNAQSIRKFFSLVLSSLLPGAISILADGLLELMK